MNENNSTASMPITIESLQAIAAEFDAINRKIQRGEAELVEKFKCSTCGRGLTITNNGFGVTYVVCRHVEQAIRDYCRESSLVPNSSDYGPSPLLGVWIEVLDDGPARW